MKKQAHATRYEPDHFPPPPRDPNSTTHKILHERHTPTDGRFATLMHKATDKEWEALWKACRPRLHKSPGPSGLTFGLLQLAPEEIQAALREIADTVLETQIMHPRAVAPSSIIWGPKRRRHRPRRAPSH
jgi:hypothetical protein